jgi:ketol-acid reductoisomerase
LSSPPGLTPFRANLPVFEALYKSVKDGSETRRSLEFNGRKTYREDLQKELDEIDQQEIWRAGKTVRALRVSKFLVDVLARTYSDLG